MPNDDEKSQVLDQPWSEKVPYSRGAGGDPGMGGSDKASILQALQKMIAAPPPSNYPTNTGIVPGNVPPIPGSTISWTGGAGATPFGGGRPLGTPPAVRTGSESIGHFANRGEATNAGLVSLGNTISQMAGRAEEKAQAKKAATAEGYMLQISGLLASGNPQDREKAQMFMDDPKIRKVLKEGIGYVPLEEQPPPEAIGVQSAMRKMSGQDQQKQAAMQAFGPKASTVAPQQQQGHAILPHASAKAQLEEAMYQAAANRANKDPNWLLSLIPGASQLSSEDQNLSERYQKGLDMPPEVAAKMNLTEKLAGIKAFDDAYRASEHYEAELMRAQIGAQASITRENIKAKARHEWNQIYRDVWKDKSLKGSDGVYVGIMNMFQREIKGYQDIIKSGKTGQGVPLTEEQKQKYQDRIDEINDQIGETKSMIGYSKSMELFGKYAQGLPMEDVDTPDEPDAGPIKEAPEPEE